jgi:hypothetical protein
MKIRYIESSPIKQVIEFEDRMKYNEFFRKRVQEIIDYTFPNNIKYEDYFIYKSVHLNKDGTPRKEIDPTKWLMSKKSQKKQKENFAKYCEKRKKETMERNYRRKLADFDSKIEYWKNEKQKFVDEYLKDF